MKKTINSVKIEKPNKRRKGVHSKNASKSQNAYKKPYKGQGK